MDRYIGTYEWVKDENFEQALIARALPDPVRKTILNNRPTSLTIRDNGDGTCTYESECGDVKISQNFKFGEPFQVDVNGDKYDAYFLLWDNKLVQRLRIPFERLEYTSYFMPRTGDTIILKTEARGIIGKRFFKLKAAK